jgi:hypothetical protein
MANSHDARPRLPPPAVDAHRDDGKCFVERADEKLTAFLKLGSTIRIAAK